MTPSAQMTIAELIAEQIDALRAEQHPGRLLSDIALAADTICRLLRLRFELGDRDGRRKPASVDPGPSVKVAGAPVCAACGRELTKDANATGMCPECQGR